MFDHIHEAMTRLGLTITTVTRGQVVAVMLMADGLSETAMMLHGPLWEALRIAGYVGQHLVDESQLTNGHCNVSVRPLEDAEAGRLHIILNWKQANPTTQRWDGFALDAARPRVARVSVGFWRHTIR